MGLYMERRIATGRAKCQICGEKIEAGLPVIHARGYQASGYVHMNCDPVARLIDEVTK